jgi:hypothetical protein
VITRQRGGRVRLDLRHPPGREPAGADRGQHGDQRRAEDRDRAQREGEAGGQHALGRHHGLQQRPETERGRSPGQRRRHRDPQHLPHDDPPHLPRRGADGPHHRQLAGPLPHRQVQEPGDDQQRHPQPDAAEGAVGRQVVDAAGLDGRVLHVAARRAGGDVQARCGLPQRGG